MDELVHCLFRDIAFGCITLAAVLTTLSMVRLVQSTRPVKRRRAAA
jgi:hypothetical protein